MWTLPLVRTPKLDSFEYLTWARRLASGDFAWPMIPAHGPGYPFALAALLAAGGGSIRFAMAVQAVVGALTAVLVAAAARRWFGAPAGVFAGLAYAFYGPAVYLDTALLSEGLLVFLLALGLWLLASDPLTWGRAAAAGAALGGAALVRPTALVIAAAMFAVLAVRANRRMLSFAALAAACCALVMMPAIIRGASASGTLTLQAYGGMNVYIGNSPLHAGRAVFRLGSGWDALNAEAARAGAVDPADQDRYWVSKTVQEIRERPLAFVRLLAVKTLWLLQAEEARDSHSYDFFTSQSWLLRLLPRMALLLPLACVGLVLVAMNGRGAGGPPWMLVAYLVASAATCVLLVVGTRYRAPFVVALAIFAGPGAAAVVEAVRGIGPWKSAAAAAAVAVIVSHLLSDPRHRNLAEEWAFTGSSLVTERDLAGAEAAYRRALELDPDSSLAWDGLGLVHYDAGRLPQAREALARARALEPANARAAFHIGLLEEREQRLPDAVRAYRDAAALSPYDAEILRRLGGALGLSGQMEDARRQIRRAVALAPADGEAWLDLCLLALDARDVKEATAALERANALGANPQRAAFAAEALARAPR